MKNKEEAKPRESDKSVELAKIHIFSERIHARMTTQVSNTYAMFIAFAVVFYTLFYESVLPLSGFVIGLTVLLIGTIYETHHIRRVFKRDLKRISDMIETVKEGRELPKLEDLVI